MQMLYLLLATLLFLAAYSIFLKPLFYLFRLKLQYGAQACIHYFPLVGTYYYFIKGYKKHRDSFYYAKYLNSAEKPYVKFRLSNLGSTVLIGLTDPEYYKQVIINHENYDKFDFIGHDQMTTSGLIYTRGEKWLSQRKLFGNSFIYDTIKEKIPVMNKFVDQELRGDRTNIIRLMQRITGSVIANSFFGEDVEGVKANGKPIYLEIVDLVNDLSVLKNTNMYVRLKQILFGQKSWSIFPTATEREVDRRIREIRAASADLINARMLQYRENPPKKDAKNDFLALYIQAYQEQKSLNITIDEIIEQFATLCMAGTDTTANLCAICLYYLADNPWDQEEIYQEIMQVKPEGDIADEDIKRLEKLHGLINEVLRVRNPALSPMMRIAKKDHYIMDLFVKKGWYINIDNFVPQLSKDYYDDPLQFNFKRWLKKDPIKNNNQFVFVPFSAGQRNCIGQHMAMIETKIILAKIVREYKSVPRPGAEVSWPTLFLYTISPDDATVLVPRIE